MFKVAELLKATSGRLITGKLDTLARRISIDSRTIKPQEVFIAIKGNNFDGHNFIGQALRKGAKAIIFQSSGYKVRPESKIPFIEVKDTVKALGDIAGFHRRKFDTPLIAVTGSNGKTTTKEMIARALSEKFKVLKNIGTKNNQIGVPLTLLELNRSYDLAVLEIGTNHFGEVDYLANICLPDIGIITNIGPSHLEYFRNLEGVFKEKYTLIEELKNPSIAILNADDGFLKKKISRSKPQLILSFAIKNRSDFLAQDIKNFSNGLQFLVNQKYRFTLNTLGYYNIYNALACVAVSRIFGIGYDALISKLASFDFPQSRLQLLKFNNIKFIDDTYNSNPLSLKQALDTLGHFGVKGRKIFVMGDMLELGDSSILFHRQVGREAAKIIDVFITVGELSKFAAIAARNKGFNTDNIFACENNLQARDILFKKVTPGPDDIVLIKGSRAMMLEGIFKK